MFHSFYFKESKLYDQNWEKLEIENEKWLIFNSKISFELRKDTKNGKYNFIPIDNQ